MAATASVSGLVSGLDTTTIVSQLMAIEKQPQTQLKTQLTATQSDAAAYRDINTSFDALAIAAKALTGKAMTAGRTAASTSTAVTATAGPTAVVGNSLSFTVAQLATAQTSLSAGTWSSATADVRTGTASGSSNPVPGWPLTVVKADGTTTAIDVPAGATLTDAAAAINKSGTGLSATIVKLDSGNFKLQVTSSATGAANGFTLRGSDASGSSAFTATSTAQDAQLDLGNGLTATSSSNTFSDLMTGVSVTVSQPGVATTISVGSDNSAITKNVQAMIDAANTVLTKISKYTDSSTGSTAPLKGDWTLTNLATQVLNQVSTAVGGKSPALAGLQLDRYGKITFDATKFASALAADPTTVQNLFGGSTAVGADGIAGSADDKVSVDGLAARLQVLGDRASDSVGGTLTSLAAGQDTRAKDLQAQIDAWDLRLTARQDTLTAQFTAMETALGTLQNQSSWLSSTLGSLSSSSKSSSSS